MEIPPAYLGRIRAIFPLLVIKSINVNQDGFANDVVIINDELIARFPRNAGAREALAMESRVLALVREKVEMPVPHYEYQAEDLVVYHIIAGEPFTRAVFFGQSKKVQNRLAEQFALFLSQLYSISAEVVQQRMIGASEAERSLEKWSALFDDIQRELFPFLWAYQKIWVRQLFAPLLNGQINLHYEPVLIHGDLGVHHILYDPGHQCLSGVIDFGTAGLGDPASDFACIIQFLGESILQRVAHFYPSITPALDRARFRAGVLELEWALHGIRENDPAWWLAHIGAARDMMSPGHP